GDGVEGPVHLDGEQRWYMAVGLVGGPGCVDRLERCGRRVPVFGVGGVQDVDGGVVDGGELGRYRSRCGVDGCREGHGLDVAADARGELAVSGGEDLVLRQTLV